MGKTLIEKLQQLSPERQRKIEQRVDELIAEEMSLKDLRKALNLTQVRMAKKLHMRQEGISRIEQRTDLLLSTLHSYIAAMGGDLHLVVTFPHRPAIRLSGLSELKNDEENNKVKVKDKSVARQRN
jgi:transcriptional regulator with XRE-family HTH domain